MWKRFSQRKASRDANSNKNNSSSRTHSSTRENWNIRACRQQKRGREIPAYMTDVAVLIVPCTGRRFFPLREISNLTGIFPAVSYYNVRNFSTMPKFFWSYPHSKGWLLPLLFAKETAQAGIRTSVPRIIFIHSSP